MNDYRPWGSPYNWKTLAEIVEPATASEDRFLTADYLQVAMLDGSIRRISVGASPTDLFVFGHGPKSELTLEQRRKPPNLASYCVDSPVQRVRIDSDVPIDQRKHKGGYFDEVVRFEGELTMELGPPATVLKYELMQRLALDRGDISTLILRYQLADEAALQLAEFPALRNLLVDSSSLTPADYAALKEHPTLAVFQGIAPAFSGQPEP